MSKVKICGLTGAEDIVAVNHVLPDYIGFVFAKSRRMVDARTAAVLKEKLEPKIKAVGVFVNEDISVISEMHQNGIIDLVQLHGDEDDGYIKRLKNNCGCEVIKAVGIGKRSKGTVPALDISSAGTVPLLGTPFHVQPDYLLFDTLSTQRGGTGKTFDWRLLKGYSGLPYFLAGGLSLENVGCAIDLLAPFCLDVSSGVETDGIKDAAKIEKFVDAVRRKNDE